VQIRALVFEKNAGTLLLWGPDAVYQWYLCTCCLPN